MIKDFSDYKFVISSGCSYGRLADYAFKPFRYLDYLGLCEEYGGDHLDTGNSKVISLNLSLGSQGSDWQADSLIYVVDKILELGVKKENIYCLVEWSQWHRFSVHPFHHYALNLELFDFQQNKINSSPNFIYEIVEPMNMKNLNNEDLLFFSEYLKVFTSKKIYNIPKLEDRIYISPQHTNPELYKEMGIDYKLFNDDSVLLEHRYPLENKLKTYFDNILRTQYFLEKHELKYNFLFMQSTLSEWNKDYDSVIKHPLFNMGARVWNIEPGDKAVYNKDYNPKNDINSDIENIMPELKTTINKINFNNFWLYNNEKYRKGGIDEWAIDNLKETGYIIVNEAHLKRGFSIGMVLPNYNGHPNMVAYIMLWNKVTTNCDFVKIKPEFEQFIWDKYWEDYNYDGITKNNITLSKKEWDRITKINT
jgi:hypothetical protein